MTGLAAEREHGVAGGAGEILDGRPRGVPAREAPGRHPARLDERGSEVVAAVGRLAHHEARGDQGGEHVDARRGGLAHVAGDLGEAGARIVALGQQVHDADDPIGLR